MPWSGLCTPGSHTGCGPSGRTSTSARPTSGHCRRACADSVMATTSMRTRESSRPRCLHQAPVSARNRATLRASTDARALPFPRPTRVRTSTMTVHEHAGSVSSRAMMSSSPRRPSRQLHSRTRRPASSIIRRAVCSPAAPRIRRSGRVEHSMRAHLHDHSAPRPPGHTTRKPPPVDRERLTQRPVDKRLAPHFLWTAPG